MTTHFEYQPPSDHPCAGVRAEHRKWQAADAAAKQQARDLSKPLPVSEPFTFKMTARLSEVRCKNCHRYLEKAPQLWNRLRAADLATGGGNARA